MKSKQQITQSKCNNLYTLLNRYSEIFITEKSHITKEIGIILNYISEACMIYHFVVEGHRERSYLCQFIFKSTLLQWNINEIRPGYVALLHGEFSVMYLDMYLLYVWCLCTLACTRMITINIIITIYTRYYLSFVLQRPYELDVI